MRFIQRLCVTSAISALTSACVGGPPSADPPVATTVEALIGDAACDSDAQCRTVAVGAKACGGPAAYLPWSARQTDGTALRTIAERDAALARKRVEKSGVMSTCSVVDDPGAYCAAPGVAPGGSSGGAPGQGSTGRQCRLRPSGTGAASKIY